MSVEHLVSGKPRVMSIVNVAPLTPSQETAVSHSSRTVTGTPRSPARAATQPARLHERIHHLGQDLIVDLARIRHFGAAGITALMHARATAGEAGVNVVVAAASRMVLRSLRITGMESVFDLYPTLSDALERSGSAERRVLSV